MSDSKPKRSQHRNTRQGPISEAEVGACISPNELGAIIDATAELVAQQGEKVLPVCIHAIAGRVHSLRYLTTLFVPLRLRLIREYLLADISSLLRFLYGSDGNLLACWWIYESDTVERAIRFLVDVMFDMRRMNLGTECHDMKISGCCEAGTFGCRVALHGQSDARGKQAQTLERQLVRAAQKEISRLAQPTRRDADSNPHATSIPPEGESKLQRSPPWPTEDQRALFAELCDWHAGLDDWSRIHAKERVSRARLAVTLEARLALIDDLQRDLGSWIDRFQPLLRGAEEGYWSTGNSLWEKATSKIVAVLECLYGHYSGAECIHQLRSRSIPARVERQVRERDRNRCIVCGSTDGIAIDHILPFWFGGEHTVENLRLLCSDCHTLRGALWDRHWQETRGRSHRIDSMEEALEIDAATFREVMRRRGSAQP